MGLGTPLLECAVALGQRVEQLLAVLPAERSVLQIHILSDEVQAASCLLMDERDTLIKQIKQNITRSDCVDGPKADAEEGNNKETTTN